MPRPGVVAVRHLAMEKLVLNQPGFQRREVHYSGHVQGVGFRYTVRRIAGRYEVTGFVRNLADGRVQLVVEGPPDQLTSMLDDIGEVLGRYIRNVDLHRSAATGEFAGFNITF